MFSAWFRWAKPPCLLGGIRHDGPRLEDGNRCAAAYRLVIDDRRHPAVWRDLEKVWGELVTTADIDRLDGVRKPAFLQKNDNLLCRFQSARNRGRFRISPVKAVGTTLTAFRPTRYPILHRGDGQQRIPRPTCLSYRSVEWLQGPLPLPTSSQPAFSP
jgi:hypothetical protein